MASIITRPHSTCPSPTLSADALYPSATAAVCRLAPTISIVSNTPAPLSIHTPVDSHERVNSVIIRHRGTTTCWLINMLHRYKTTVYCHPGTPDAMAYTSIIYSPDTVRALRRALFTDAHIPLR